MVHNVSGAEKAAVYLFELRENAIENDSNENITKLNLGEKHTLNQ